MKEILIWSPKGGDGKTTICYSMIQFLGTTCDAVDLDPQHSLSTALNVAGIQMSQPNAKYRIYDTAPFNDASLDQIIPNVDHILLPAKLGYPDLVSFRTAYERLLKANVAHKALLVFNDVRKPLTQEAKEVLRLFRKNYPKIKVADTFISRLEAFRRVFRFPLEGKAAMQISSLLAEIGINDRFK